MKYKKKKLILKNLNFGKDGKTIELTSQDLIILLCLKKCLKEIKETKKRSDSNSLFKNDMTSII